MCSHEPTSFEASGTFRNNLLFHSEELFVPRPKPKLEKQHLSAICDAYSINSQLPFIFGGRLFHPQSEKTPCHGDKDPHYLGFDHVNNITSREQIMKLLIM